MKVLITGGAGFIGSHLAEALLGRGDEVIVVDNFATARRDNLAGADGVVLVEDSIADAAAVDRAFDEFVPDVVLHAAASYKDPDDWTGDIRTNVEGTANVVRAAERVGVRRLIYFQTALCYGNRPLEQPITLDHPLRPESSYAISKTAGEHYIASSGLDFVSFRLANVYGPRNVSGPAPTFFMRLSSGKPCFAVETRRDFVYVRDLVDIVLLAVEGRGRSGYYHVSSGSDVSIEELYYAVTAAMGIDVPVEVRPRPEDDAPSILLDPGKTKSEFDWQVAVPLQQGIAETVAWYEQHGVEETYTHLRMRT